MNAVAHTNIFESLSAIMKMHSGNFTAETKEEMESFFSYCAAGMDNDSQKLLATLLINALNKRIRSERIGENIYLGKYEVSQIQLFDILIKKFPYVKYSQQIVNNAIANIIREHTEATLIDIGIGLGSQMINILGALENMPWLKKIHIVGIEPYGDALAQAGQNIRAFAEQVPFEIEFTAICDGVENVDFASIPNLRGAVVVNASLALHHIQSDKQRTETMAKIKAINPAAFFLIEPNVDHFESDFHKRFENCYNHFYSLFQVIDRLDVENDDKNALKMFFGREIDDVIGKEEKDRFEKHEPATRWIERLNETRFILKTDFLKRPLPSAYGVEMRMHPEGFLGFTFDQETALAVICAF